MHLDFVRVDREQVEQVGEQKIEESFNLWGETSQLILLSIPGERKLSGTFFRSLAQILDLWDEKG